MQKNIPEIKKSISLRNEKSSPKINTEIKPKNKVQFNNDTQTEDKKLNVKPSQLEDTNAKTPDAKKVKC